MVIDNPTAPRKTSAGFGRLTGSVRSVTKDVVAKVLVSKSSVTTYATKVRRLRLALRRLWVHTIRRVPTREENVLRLIRERTIERHEMDQWASRS